MQKAQKAQLSISQWFYSKLQFSLIMGLLKLNIFIVHLDFLHEGLMFSVLFLVSSHAHVFSRKEEQTLAFGKN